MADTGGQLSGRQERVLLALLDTPSIKAAAAATGVNEKTVRRWLRQPEFQAAYRAARRAVVEETLALLQRIGAKAVAALHKNLACEKPAVEVAAAVAILDRAIRGVELSDLAERVEELERDKERQQEGEKWQRP
jgi:hypothetical protein